jgi:DNA-binding CsgD family transcriptional regulator
MTGGMAFESGEARSFAETRRGDPDRGWLQRWFELYPCPTFIVSRDLRLAAMNARARGLAHDQRLIAIRAGFVTAAGGQSQDTLAAAVALASFDQPVRRIFRAGDAIHVVRASVVDPSPGSLVMLSFPDAGRPPTCAPLKEAFGVTAAEQKVIDRLVRGFTVEAAAEAMGLSLLTVRTQTKRAYAKLGVSTREELFARLLPFLEFGAA